jgi:hypothetical protein
MSNQTYGYRLSFTKINDNEVHNTDFLFTDAQAQALQTALKALLAYVMHDGDASVLHSYELDKATIKARNVYLGAES